VRGVQQQGVAATVKHFVANDSETDRYTVDVLVDEATLHEVYLTPFREIVAAGAWAVMAAYNLVGGEVMTESSLLRDVLHDQWGFDGVTMSDWFAVRSVAPSARSALDLAMPGPASPWADGLEAAIRGGDVDETVLDDKVRRILRLAARVGALDGIDPVIPEGRRQSFDAATQRALLTHAAAAGTVLLKNDGAGGPVLPLASDVGSIAVIGPAAVAARTLGGGSATVYPAQVVSPLDALTARLGSTATVRYESGVGINARHALIDWQRCTPPGSEEAGLLVRFLDADGAELASEVRRAGLLKWLGDFAEGAPRRAVAVIEVAGTYTARIAGDFAFGCSGVGGFSLDVGGSTVIDGALALPPGTDPIEAQIRPPQRVATVRLDEGQRVAVTLRHIVDQSRPTTKLELNVDEPVADEAESIEAAVRAARASEVAVVFVGTTAEIETESMDRSSLALPGRQDELVSRIAAANPRTVVVLNSGAPVLLPWLGEVAAVLTGWFGGEELGPAIAEVLVGDREPGGRLPVSWPAEDHAHIPTTVPEDGLLRYDERDRIGYRSRPRRAENELFPFGHGLGYTTWELRQTSVRSVDGGVAVDVVVANTGDRHGTQVVQVYAREGLGESRLVGFASVTADAGQSAAASVTIPERRWARYDAGAWNAPSDAVELTVGFSLDDAGAKHRIER
jgi:beta-glucosidase